MLKILKSIWAREPVLVGTLIPLAAVVGLLTQQQASAITTAITSLVTVVATLLAAFKVRAKVTPTGVKVTTPVASVSASTGGVTVSTPVASATVSTGGLLGVVKRLLGKPL